MKVLLITSEMNNPFTPTGGAFNLLRARSLSKIGIELKIINPVALNAPIKSLLKSPKMRSVALLFKRINKIAGCKKIKEFEACYRPWIHLPKLWFWYGEVDILHLLLGKTIMGTIDSFKPDLILASWLHPFGTYAKYTKRRFPVPVIAISEGSDLLVWPKKYKGIKKIYADYVNYVDHLIYVSEAQKNETFSYFPFKKSRVIHNGYDGELFKYERAHFKGKRDMIKIISVGSLTFNKGHDLLLRAMKELDKRFNLVLVGDGVNRKKYELTIRKRSLQNRVKLIGEVEPSHVKDLMLECDVYCQPSRTESFGIAVLEAMACGRPVVASRVGGLPELVSEGFNGYQFEPGNVGDIARKIQMAADNKWDNEEIANWTMHNWGWEKWAAKINKVFEEVSASNQ
jgi:glycosyltransferase involved in cell wall biosynthesis